jgi:hypothetical protein
MLDPNDKKEIDRMIDLKTRREYSKRIGDTPNDALQLAPRKYVNMYGSIAGRPASIAASVGQQYFDTTGNRPIFFTSNNNWVDSVGSVVAFN